ASERQCTFQDISRRKDAEFVTQLTVTAAAVEHGDDGVQAEPGVALETAAQNGNSSPAARTSYIELKQSSDEACDPHLLQFRHGLTRAARSTTSRDFRQSTANGCRLRGRRAYLRNCGNRDG